MRMSPVALIAALALAGSPAFAAPKAPAPAHFATAVLAGGCFWGMEDVFERLAGVRDVTVGYTGGAAQTARYEIVSTGLTHHAESIRISYDPARVSYATLLDVFFTVAHDPTEKDRQGPDDGSQYRSAVFYANGDQKRAADAAIARLDRGAMKVATEVVPLGAFYPAEAYHQHFADRNPTYPYIVNVDEPKVIALRERYPALLKAR